MKNLIFGLTVAGLYFFAANGVLAQNTEKKDAEPPKTTTADAWRDALPLNQPTTPPIIVMEESVENVEAKESSAEVEKRIVDLERRMMEAIKGHDTETLKLLIGDDFVLTGLDLPGTEPDKNRYIDWTKTKLELKAYTIQSVSVRAYSRIALVTYRYKRQANIAGASADGDFTVTDVWLQRQKRWQSVSQHISPSIIAVSSTK